MNTNPFEAHRKGDRKWGVVLRLGEHESIDQRLTFSTKRAAISAASAFNREHRSLNAESQVQA